MNRQLAIVTLVIIAVAIFLGSLYFFLSAPVIKPPLKTAQYLNFSNSIQGGTETKVYLVNSSFFYGAYEESFIRSGATGSYSITNGDPCVIINGTIRNDYDNDYYFSITADVFNSRGDKIGPILTINSPHPGFTVAYAEIGESNNFSIQIKYDSKDITDYDLFVAFEPTDSPPP